VVEPSLLCSAGYYCMESAQTSTPIQDSNANICPVGHYCPEGTDEPIKCPVSTFSNNTQLRIVGDCTPCTAGKLFQDLSLFASFDLDPAILLT
jgi:hypothetical protein